MEPSTLIPLAAIVLGIPGFVAFVAVLANHQRRIKALAIRAKELELGGSDAVLGPAVAALDSDLTDMRAKMADLQERLDFAERVLVAGSLTQNETKAERSTA